MGPDGHAGIEIEPSGGADYPTAPLAGGGVGIALLALGILAAFLSPKREIASAPQTPTRALPVVPATDIADTDTVPGASPRSSSPDVLADLPPPAQAPEVDPAPVGLVARLRAALGRSREALQGRFDALFGKPVDDALFDELEETLLIADVGIDTATRITDKLRAMAKSDADGPVLRAALREEMRTILTAVQAPMATVETGPLVILVVGVNGSGKTTTIGKLASKYAASGKSVLLAAADTYRAAAVDQLKVWAERTGADFVSHDEGADPGAVAYDALEAAAARDHDVVIIDTAGRLQTAKPLMEQLSKLRRVVQKRVADGPHETLLVLDGTMGQNGLSQARQFNEATPLSGVVVTKLDGTAKGGMVLTIAAELELPVKYIGIGEGIDDLRPFEASAFVDALA